MSERLTDEQLNDLGSFFWGDWVNWLDHDRENAGRVLLVIAEVRALRDENARLRGELDEARKIASEFRDRFEDAYDRYLDERAHGAESEGDE